MTVSATVKNIIKQHEKTKPELQPYFLQNYTEYRYMQIVGSLHKLVEHFYRTKNMSAARCCIDNIAQFTKNDHVKLVLEKNSYHVNNSFTATKLTPL
jgi:hypothetical protein